MTCDKRQRRVGAPSQHVGDKIRSGQAVTDTRMQYMHIHTHWSYQEIWHKKDTCMAWKKSGFVDIYYILYVYVYVIFQIVCVILHRCADLTMCFSGKTKLGCVWKNVCVCARVMIKTSVSVSQQWSCKALPQRILVIPEAHDYTSFLL